MTDDPKCVAGCISFYGGERKHHKDCPYYAESLTKLNADRIEALEAEVSKAREEGRRAGLEEAFDKVESLSYDWGEDGCSYLDRDEALTEIRALIDKPGDAQKEGE